MGRDILSYLFEFIKYIFLYGKKLIKYLLSLRIGIQPQFKSGLRNFDFKTSILGIKRKLQNLRQINFQGIKRRVKRVFLSKKSAKLYAYLLPVIIALVVLRVVSPISAQLSGFDERLSQYLLNNDPVVGIEKDADLNDQVYYLFEGNKYFVTDSAGAKGEAVSSNENIAWSESVAGNWQIFLYNIPTSILTQLTYSGNNVSPKISDGKVVWQGIRSDGDWQVYLYDGTSIGPVSSGDQSFTPDIKGNFVVYSRKDISGQWRSTAYSINDREAVDIDYGEDNQYVKLDGKNIIIGFKGKSKKFNLNVEDLLILNLGSLSPLSSSSIESIQNEIDALLAQ